MESTTFSSTVLSAKSLSVHRDLPPGGLEQAIVTTSAFALPSIFGGAPLRDFSFNADCRPSWQYLPLIRATVDLATCNDFEIWSSEYPSSAISSILARFKLLADAIPWWRYRYSSLRSSSFNLTWCTIFLNTIIILKTDLLLLRI